ncbi:hypothetical protein WN48_07966 [Eufriesea mexicana]|uniref:Uncharacterized protein n=1 Tax=Eufriesea mexicana TaxID=516756 RepID=A0A310SSJ7_9HYME|nr:hypothetical protein WN48_07966 [Eufriesea mexicana]
MDCQQNVSHVFECGKQNLRRKLEVSIDERIKMDIIFENLQWSSCHNLKNLLSVNLITGDSGEVMLKENEVIALKNKEEIFVGKMDNNGLYTSRKEQEACREAQKIGKSMYREDERVVHEKNKNAQVKHEQQLLKIIKSIVIVVNSQDQQPRDRKIRKNYGKSSNRYEYERQAFMEGKPIRVWRSKGCLYQTINNRTDKSSDENSIDIEYHEQTSNLIGHWTLLSDKDPINVELDLNSCLFTAIAIQIGIGTNHLRANTIDFLMNNTEYLIDQIDKLIFSNNNSNKTSLMIGGARYIGTSPRAAGIILDNSQNVLCHACSEYGHPRGHAFCRDATNPMDNVQNYSRITKSRKSGFLSRVDQNNIAHLALSHEKAQRAMAKLNNGTISQSILFSRRDLRNNDHVLPKMIIYYNGEICSGQLDIIRVTLVLRHHLGEYNNPEADVFVHTFYPRSS